MPDGTDAISGGSAASGRAVDKGQPADDRSAVADNRRRLIGAQALQNAGDQIVKASTVLTWLLASLGAPAWTIGLLVPIRESGSMLPQAVLTPWVRRFSMRKWIWVIGGAGQAIAVAAMAMTAATASGTLAGVLILTELAVFALARSLTSIASKDVTGRTIPKGERGDINGIAALVSGAIAVTVGLGIRFLGTGEPDVDVLAGLLAVASLAWVAALLVFASIREPAADGEESGSAGEGWVARSWSLLRYDIPFRKFVTVRALLLVSALSPPFIVSLAAERDDLGLGGLGPFVIASGLAAIIGGRPFGRLADTSSRALMIWGAAAASLVIVALVAAMALSGVDNGSPWLFVVAYFLLTLTHTGVRVARKTYVVDMAEGDQRTDYVAVSNSAMGVLLLVTGAVSSALAILGAEVALAFLAALGIAGMLVGRSLPDVSKGAS